MDRWHSGTFFFYPTIKYSDKLKIFLFYIGGVCVGPAYDRYGGWWIMIFGSFLCSASWLFSSFASRYYQIFISQGILFGIGNSMLFYPTAAIILKSFGRTRCSALGICAAGVFWGSTIWRMTIGPLVNAIGILWTYRSLSLISLLTLGPPLFFIRDPIIPYAQPNDEAKQPGRRSLTNKQHIILVLAYCFMNIGLLVPLYFVPVFGAFYTEEYTKLSRIILCAAASFGSITFGFAGDWAGRFTALLATATAAGFVAILQSLMISQSLSLLFAILYGLLSGGVLPLGLVCAIPDGKEEYIGSHLGLVLGVCSVCVIGGPLSSMLLEKCSGDLLWVSMLSGLSTLAGSSLLVLSRWWLDIE